MSLAGDTTMMMMMMMIVTTQQTNAHTNGGENSTPASGGVTNQSIINQFHLPHLCLRFCKYITHTHAHTHARTQAHTHTHTHTHTFNGPFSGTTRVIRYQKGEINVDFTEARDSEWQWHQLGHMQVASRSRQITTPVPHHSSFLSGRMPFLPPNQQRQSTEGNLQVHQIRENIMTQ